MDDAVKAKHLQKIKLGLYRRAWTRFSTEDPLYADDLRAGIAAGLTVREVTTALLTECNYSDRSGFITTMTHAAEWVQHELRGGDE